VCTAQKLLQVCEQMKITWSQVRTVGRMKKYVPGKVSRYVLCANRLYFLGDHRSNINTQNIRIWREEYPHATQQVPLHSADAVHVQWVLQFRTSECVAWLVYTPQGILAGRRGSIPLYNMICMCCLLTLISNKAGRVTAMYPECSQNKLLPLYHKQYVCLNWTHCTTRQFITFCLNWILGPSRQFITYLVSLWVVHLSTNT
jgi:hypothetical protein